MHGHFRIYIYYIYIYQYERSKSIDKLPTLYDGIQNVIRETNISEICLILG